MFAVYSLAIAINLCCVFFRAEDYPYIINLVSALIGLIFIIRNSFISVDLKSELIIQTFIDELGQAD